MTNIEVERSRDWAAIKALLFHPAIFSSISDDFTPPSENYELPMSDDIVYLLARDREGPFGFAIFVPRNRICYDAHLGFLPRGYGAKALAAFKEMLDWMWINTLASRIVGEISQGNRRAIQFVTRAGFQAYGVNRKSKLQGGELQDQIALGISRP